jgi:aminoglycoside phosphotransferase (APT) family kinase protein
MTAVEAERPDGTLQRFVIRKSPTIAEEFQLLRALRELGLPVPNPRNLDKASAVFDYIDGAPRFELEAGNDTARVCAEQLVAIHKIDGTRPEFAGLKDRVEHVQWHYDNLRPQLDESVREPEVRAVLGPMWPPPPVPSSLVHGDVWPGNLLWKDGELVAVIDWEDAGVGDPLYDVAITRLDLLWAFGPEVMTDFTDQYAELSGRDLTHLPMWDLAAAGRPAGQISSWAADWDKYGRSDVTPDTMRNDVHWFVSRAFTALGV